MKRSLFLFLALILLLSACRVRTTLPPLEDETTPDETGQVPPPPAQPPAQPLTDPQTDPPAQSQPEPPTEPPTDPSPEEPPEEPEDAPEEGDAENDPEAAVPEYDPDADAQITPGAEDALAANDAPSQDDPAPEEPGEAASQDPEAERSAVETVPVPDSDDAGVSDDGETAETVLQYYETLLSERLGDLFECKRLNVYWETAGDRVTVYKTSPEHAIILTAGAYDVSARLLQENLTVDDGWISRKNPDVIVKAVEGPLPAAPGALAEEIAARPELAGTGAVREGRVLLVSTRLLQGQAMQTAAAVWLACSLYPEQFEDVDPEAALADLAAEAGISLEGNYFYKGR